MKKGLKIGVLRGGPSTEHDVSMKSGESVLQSFRKRFNTSDITISKEGNWYLDYKKIDPLDALKYIDVAFNALHGQYGEDGKVQQFLDLHKVPYTGSGAVSSAVGMNKVFSKKVYLDSDIKTPSYVVFRKGMNVEKAAFKIFREFSQKCVVKPVVGGSSIGVSLTDSVDGLVIAINKALDACDYVLIEEFIEGREGSCGVVENFRDERVYSLLPIEIVSPKENKFFDYDAKYSGKSEEICPGNFTQEEKEQMQNLAAACHKSLGLDHYSRTDFIISPKRGIFVLETNSLPGLTRESLLPKSLEAVGCGFDDFLDHLVGLTKRK